MLMLYEIPEVKSRCNLTPKPDKLPVAVGGYQTT